MVAGGWDPAPLAVRDRRHRPEADSYRAIAVRCWPASWCLGCTGTGARVPRLVRPI